MVRHRTWLLQETVLPVLSVTALAFMYRAMMPGDPERAKTFIGVVILGAAMTTFWMNILWSMGAHLYWERDGGNLELYIMSPAPLMSILMGMALGGMTTTLVRAAAILTAGVLLFDVPFRPDSWWLLGLIFALTMVSLYGLGMMFASLFLMWGREAWHTVNLLQEPVYLLSGMNFPLYVLGNLIGKAVPAIALLIPLAAGIDAMRQVLFGIQGFLPVWVEIGILAALGVVFVTLAIRCLNVLERKAKADGKLTVKWQ
jgi:ABC-2 type transport system permease protein